MTFIFNMFNDQILRLNYMTLLQVQNAGDNAMLCHIHYLIFSDKHIH